MGTEELTDLSPPPEVVALGRPERVFRQSTASVKDARLSFFLFGIPSALIGLLLVSLPVAVLFIKERDRAKIEPIMLLVPPLFSLFFFAVAGFLYAKAANAKNLAAYAIYPTALAIWRDGLWSVIAWSEVSKFLPHGLFRWYPALRLAEGRTEILRYKIENPWRLSVAVGNAYRAARGEHDDPVLKLLRRALAGGLALLAALAPLGAPVLARWERPEMRTRLRRGFGAFVLCVSLGLTAYSWRWLSNALTGPVPLTRDQLLEVADGTVLPNPYVAVPMDKVVETDVIQRHGYGRWGTYFGQLYLAQVGERWLLAEMPVGKKETTFRGILEVWSPPSPSQEKMFKEARKRLPAGSEILPFQMDGAYRYRSEATSMAVLWGILFVVGGYFLLRACPRSQPKSPT
jgi:hypothetical protein